MGESITEVQIGAWLKQPGDYVAMDDSIVEIESDKATVELPAPVGGTIKEIVKQVGEQANVGDVIGFMEEGEAPAGEVASQTATPAEAPAAGSADGSSGHVMPSAARVLAQAGALASQVSGTGPGGRVLKEDAQRHVAGKTQPAAASASAPPGAPNGPRDEEVVPMSPLRKRVAQTLVAAQQDAALLTTFNEVDMTSVMEVRSRYKDAYTEKYGIKLGFMSFFVKASIDALRTLPQVNAEVRGTDIVYKNYNDIGIAVGGGKGLVVPVLRSAERMSFAEIELAISDFGQRAAKNKIKLEELQGGTFTISNGGVYGSLLSTPIVNPPQSAILGMHAIQQRPMAINGEVVIRPMMYLALSYDHRVVDGREAVTFLKRIKECLEDPSRMLLEI
jgi:2-oxoglutarate dehydrogenase E2 component (dihydrolipoamide succinyltransferase)